MDLDQQEHYSYINVDSRNCEFWVVNQCVTFCLMWHLNLQKFKDLYIETAPNSDILTTNLQKNQTEMTT